MHHNTTAAAGLVVCALSSALLAQPTDGPTVYRLTQESSYTKGCFPPCLCPLLFANGVTGTLTLTPTGVDPLFAHYDVTDVNLFVFAGENRVHITGSGTYKIGGEVALVERMELDLRTDNREPAHFDSGFVPAGGGFPQTLDLTISMNNMVCFDIVIGITAEAVPSSEIQPYQLTDESTFQEGCFIGCACPTTPELSLLGTFALVLLSNNGLFAEYSVIDVDWYYLPAVPPIPQAVPIDGVGLYRVGGEVAAMHEMILDASVAGGPPERFHSNLVIGGNEFPDINILMTINDFICFDRVIDLHAVPGTLVTIVSANPPLDNPYLPDTQPFRDVLQTGISDELTHGIGGAGTPGEHEVTYGTIQVTFSGPTQLAAEDISVACSYTGDPTGSTPCPTVVSVQQNVVGDFALALSGPIPPGGCTILSFANAAPGQQLRYQSAPGDASMNGLANTQDLLLLVQALNNGDADAAENLPRYDMNRSGGVNTQDLLRLIQLLNGAQTTQPWSGFQMVPCVVTGP